MSPRYETVVVLGGHALSFHKRDNFMHRHLVEGRFGRGGAWSADSRLFVCAAWDGGDFLDQHDLGSGLRCFEFKPNGLDKNFDKHWGEQRSSFPAQREASMQLRRAAWQGGGRAAQPFVTLKDVPLDSNIESALERLCQGVLNPARASSRPWQDAGEYQVDDEALFANLVDGWRAFEEAEDTGAGWRATRAMLAVHPDHAPARYLRGMLRLHAKDQKQGLPDFIYALHVDQGASDISQRVLTQLAQMYFERGKDAQAIDCLVRMHALGYPGPDGWSLVQATLARYGKPILQSEKDRPIIHLPEPAEAVPKAKPELLAQTLPGLVIVYDDYGQFKCHGLLISSAGHILTCFDKLGPEGVPLFVSFHRSREGIQERYKKIEALWVRSDFMLNLALLKAVAMPNDVQPLTLARRLPMEGEAVMICAQPQAKSKADAIDLYSGAIVHPGIRVNQGRFFLHSAGVTEAGWGAPLLATDGTVLGMRTSPVGTNYDWIRYPLLSEAALSASFLREWIVDPDQPVEKPGKVAP